MYVMMYMLGDPGLACHFRVTTSQLSGYMQAALATGLQPAAPASSRPAAAVHSGCGITGTATSNESQRNPSTLRPNPCYVPMSKPKAISLNPASSPVWSHVPCLTEFMWGLRPPPHTHILSQTCLHECHFALVICSPQPFTDLL